MPAELRYTWTPTGLSTSLTSFAAWPASTRTYHLTEVLLLVVI